MYKIREFRLRNHPIPQPSDFKFKRNRIPPRNPRQGTITTFYTYAYNTRRRAARNRAGGGSSAMTVGRRWRRRISGASRAPRRGLRAREGESERGIERKRERKRGTTTTTTAGSLTRVVSRPRLSLLGSTPFQSLLLPAPRRNQRSIGSFCCCSCW